MGMSAGQARLLSITARLSNNEQSGQSLSFAKQRLADEVDQINRVYNEALNATKLTVLTGFNGVDSVYTDISYALLTGYNKVASGKQYIVSDNKGRILVQENIKKAYECGNGDFNKFLNYLGYSQNDVNFESYSTDEEKLQAVHDAWDRYVKSVGYSFYTQEHDFADADVIYGWQKSEAGKAVGYPYVQLKYIESDQILKAIFENKADDGTAIIPELQVDKYTLYQGADIYGTPANKYNKPEYYLVATDNEGNQQLYQFVYPSETAGSYSIFKYNPDKNEFEDTNFITSVAEESKVTEATLTACVPFDTKWPLSFDGTTKEQREWYDYAVAISQAYAGEDIVVKESGAALDVKSVADNPENAGIVKYYKNIFDQMKQFGYVTDNDPEINQSLKRNISQDNNWFEQAIRQGKLILKTYDSSKGGFVNTSYTEDSNIQEVEDERKIAKAQVEYDQAQEALERKDKKIDLELKKLDTEHNALQTEYESVKNVVDKNIEKSFNIFS